jgi:hypothetical protein
MTNDIQSRDKRLVTQLCDAMYDFESGNVLDTLERLLTADCRVRMGHPFGDLIGAISFYNNVYQGLFETLPDLERRDYIRIRPFRN